MPDLFQSKKSLFSVKYPSVPKKLRTTSSSKTPKKSSSENSPTKEPKEETGYAEAFKLVMENNRQTMEILMKTSMNRAPDEARRSEDQSG